jgi:hypothetical protein
MDRLDSLFRPEFKLELKSGTGMNKGASNPIAIVIPSVTSRSMLTISSSMARDEVGVSPDEPFLAQANEPALMLPMSQAYAIAFMSDLHRTTLLNELNSRHLGNAFTS